MNRFLCALGLAACGAIVTQPAAAVVFPSLTTIYVGSGVVANPSVITTIHCTNVSGTTVNVRFQFLNPLGSTAGSHTASLINGATYGVSTADTQIYTESFFFNPALVLAEGGLNVEATNSAVFCTAKTVSAGFSTPNGYAFSLVRVNPHPGTAE
jgi:hypothetical protein